MFINSVLYVCKLIELTYIYFILISHLLRKVGLYLCKVEMKLKIVLLNWSIK